MVVLPLRYRIDVPKGVRTLCEWAGGVVFGRGGIVSVERLLPAISGSSQSGGLGGYTNIKKTLQQ